MDPLGGSTEAIACHTVCYLKHRYISFYSIVYVILHGNYGNSAGILSFLPVVVLAWLYGLRLGLLATGMTACLNVALIILVGEGTLDTITIQNLAFATVALSALGVLTGLASDAKGRAAAELAARQVAESALAQSEERYRTLIENQGEGAGIVDAQEIFRFANSAAHRIFGMPPGALVGRDVREFFRVDDHAQLALETAKRSRGESSSYEAVIIRPDASECTILVTATPQYDPQGTFTGTFGVFRDITERKQAEAERERLIAELQKALTVVKTLGGLLPICASCKKIRDDQGYWQQVEVYIRDHTDAEFSHGICPDCMRRLYPEFAEDEALKPN